jgi:hypothetical protein
MTQVFALKEWSSVCAALGRGDQIFTLRKGGIEEEEGEFKPRHASFYLYPTHEHERPSALREQARPLLQTDAAEKAGSIPFALFAQCDWVEPVQTLQAARRLASETIWTTKAVEERFALYPDKPLWMLALRVCRLPSVIPIPHDPSYAGCRSWVPLVHFPNLPTSTFQPVISKESYAARIAILRDLLQAP